MEQRSHKSLLGGLTVVLLFAIPVLAQQPSPSPTTAQTGKATRSKTKQKKPTSSKPVNELARLREEYIKATKDYKASLGRLRESYQKNVTKAEAELTKSQELFDAGLISKDKLLASERELASAKGQVSDVDVQINGADNQIADTLLEAEAEAKLARSKPLPRGGFVKNAAYIRFNGGANWILSDSWKVQNFFQGTFKHPLPIAVYGQGAIHDKWRLDHRNSMDVSLHPDSAEGQALLSYLRANGIPFLAFRAAIPGTATGPHIHIGHPSHRY